MKLLVIRGDLQAHSGYSAAIRAYCSLLKSHFDRVVGVDIHFSKDRPFEPFPHPVVSEAEARYLSVTACSTLAVSITTPNHYVRLPGAVNVGLTFWETDRWPTGGQTRSPWIAQANRMDALWSASSYSKNAFESIGVSVPIRVIPWPVAHPQEFEPGMPNGEVYDLDRCLTSTPSLASLGELKARWFGWSRRAARLIASRAGNCYLNHLRATSSVIPHAGAKSFLCVAQDVPRKGLLLFLSEWLEFKRCRQARPWSLILKSTPYNTGVSKFDFVRKFWRHIRNLKRQLRIDRADVYLWTSDLPNKDFNRLIGNTVASVSPSFGEGFCGPAGLALASNKPLIAPRHTSLIDYLPSTYPFLFASRPVRGQFVDDAVGLYAPYSTWHVPEPGAMAQSLRRVITCDALSRQLACEQAKQHLAGWCSPDRIRKLLAREVAWAEEKLNQITERAA